MLDMIILAINFYLNMVKKISILSYIFIQNSSLKGDKFWLNNYDFQTFLKLNKKSTTKVAKVNICIRQIPSKRNEENR